MHIKHVKDSAGETLYSYDADMSLATADNQLSFYVSQASAVEAKIYEVKYGHIVYPELIPIGRSLPEWAESFTYFSFDGVTMGKFIGTSATDLPEVEVNKAKSTSPLFYGGISYSYDLNEMRVSQNMGMPVDSTKGKLSRRGFEEHAQSVAFFGDSDRGVTGLFNNTNVARDNVTITAASATGDEWFTEFNSLLLKIWTDSAETVLPDTLVIPSSMWSIVSGKKMTATGSTDTTVLEYLAKNNMYTQQTGQPLTVKSNLQLNTAGTGGVPRMMAYEKTPENLTMEMPIEWRPLPPQADGLAVKVPAEYKFGGVEIRYPGAMAYRDFA